MIDLSYLNNLSLDDRIKEINFIKLELKKYSPFANEPVDCVLWVKSDNVVANDYNPNAVAPPEMELLKTSIESDGYTQPIVTFNRDGINEVIDGFHRNRVGKEYPDITKRIYGYLPIVEINSDSQDRGNRIAATIRHNRARGKHKITAMSDIIIELKNRNWTNARIAKQLGMDEEEILRLCQITGLEGLFKDEEFSRAWEISEAGDNEFISFTDEVNDNEKSYHGFRTANTSDPNRIFHTFDKWECQKAGFYKTNVTGMSKEECENAYAEFLSNLALFEDILNKVITEWECSCEHYLTNIAMNRIAWLGQACMCYHTGIPSTFCAGYNKLSRKQQNDADELALKYLNIFLAKYDMGQLTLEEAISEGRQVEIY